MTSPRLSQRLRDALRGDVFAVKLFPEGMEKIVSEVEALEGRLEDARGWCLRVRDLERTASQTNLFLPYSVLKELEAALGEAE